MTDATSSADIPSADIPRFRAVNEEVVSLDTDFGYAFGGVLTDAAGRAKALWASYAKPADGEVRDLVRGMPWAPVSDAVTQILEWKRRERETSRKEEEEEEEDESSRRQVVYLLDAEFGSMPLAKAADHGVPSAWIETLLRADPVRRQALTVASTVACTGADDVLKGGDVVLEAGGRAATTFRAVEDAVAAAVAARGDEVRFIHWFPYDRVGVVNADP